MTETISVEEAEDRLDIALARQHVSRHRWYNKVLIVYEDDARLLGFYYLDPKSELQEDQDRYESDPVEVFEVIAETATTTRYRPSVA